MTDALIDDIFDESPAAPNFSSAETDLNKAKDSDSDDLFGNSDDEVDNLPKSKSTKTAVADEDDDLFGAADDDDEEVAAQRRKLTTSTSSKRKRISIGKKVGNKRSRGSGAEGTLNRESAGDSGDEYDSESEPIETQEDRDFIDDVDDEDADLLREYSADNQIFDDERPINRSSKKKSSTARGERLKISGKNNDPLSQTMMAMRRPKTKSMTDAEKENFIDKLQRRMQQAVQRDDELFELHQPAVHKLQMLSEVKQALITKPLHNMLLEKDILSNLRDWIMPRSKGKALPALTVRQTIYELLLQLPCQLDHLKRVTNPGKPPIGVVIKELRKSSMETDSNKRLLKQIMEKWSRFIFSKTADVRYSNVDSERQTVNPGGVAGDDEIEKAIIRKYDQSSGGKTKPTAKASNGFEQIISTQESIHVDDKTNRKLRNDDPSSRVRTPFNQGFLFTVQPALKIIDKRDMLEKTWGEKKSQLMRKMIDSSKGSSKGLGKKTNPRAMDMSVSGGNVKF